MTALAADSYATRIAGLLYTRGEMSPRDLAEALGINRHATKKPLEQLTKSGHIEGSGNTRLRLYRLTAIGRKCHVKQGDASIALSHYAGEQDMSLRARAVAARAGVVARPVTTRRATPEELARCTQPAASAAAPSPAPPRVSPARPSTPPVAATPPSSPPAEEADAVPVFIETTASLLEHDHLEGKHDGAPDARCPECASQITPPSEGPAAESAIDGVAAVPASLVDLDWDSQRVRRVTFSRGASADDRIVESIRDAPTLDDATLAREQLRTRYCLALIKQVDGGKDDPSLLDRIEKLIA